MTTDQGSRGCQPQVQYLYEMEFSEEVIPKIGDGEVGQIYLKALDEVLAAAVNGGIQVTFISHSAWAFDGGRTSPT